MTSCAGSRHCTAWWVMHHLVLAAHWSPSVHSRHRLNKDVAPPRHLTMAAPPPLCHRATAAPLPAARAPPPSARASTLENATTECRSPLPSNTGTAALHSRGALPCERASALSAHCGPPSMLGRALRAGRIVPQRLLCWWAAGGFRPCGL
jgi:hypothetical protein